MTNQTNSTNREPKKQDGNRLNRYHHAPERDTRYFDRIPHVVAKYRESRLPRHRGNPYVLALPQLPTDQELLRALSYLPKFHAEDRQRPPGERIVMLNQLSNIFVATARHTRLLRAMLRLMTQGYEKRNPKTATYRQEIQASYEAMQATGTYRQLTAANLRSQLSMGLAGAAGVGKTYTMRNIMNLLPPAIYHPLTNSWQLPFLFIEMPYDGQSVHTLASSIFEELDRLLPGENYGQTYMLDVKANAETRLAMALKVATEHGVGMLIVDEQQNQRHIGNMKEAFHKRMRHPKAGVNSPGNETPLIKLLITASNNAHIPLCLTGTLESQEIVGARFTRGRRMAGNGSALWLPLQPTFDLREDKQGEFETTMQVLWKYQWVKKPCEITPQLHDLFWRLTQGLPDMMVKLFSATQEAAIVSEKETMTPQLFQATYDSQFWAAHLGLEALRTGDPVLTDAVPDLHHSVRSPVFRAEVMEALADFRQRNGLPMSQEEVAALAEARAARSAALKAERKEAADQRNADKTASAMKRAVDTAMDDGDAALAGELARNAVLAGINPAGVSKRA